MSIEPRREKTGLRGFRPGLTQTDLYSHRSRLRIQEEEEFYYPSSKNKGADQLRTYCEADLRLCFRIDKNPVFSLCDSINIHIDQISIVVIYHLP